MRKLLPPPPFNFTRFKLWRKHPPKRRRKRLRKPPTVTVPETSSSAANDDVVRDRISKTAIATAVLSTKWKHLFASIPNLCLVIDDGAVSNQPNPNFVDFMDHLLNVTLRNVPSIRRFELVCRHDYGNSHVDAWVSTALGLKVSAINLCFPVENTGVSIEGVFQCETLEVLVLYQHLYVEVPDMVFLPNLTVLGLGSVKFPDIESLEIIISGCPVLEELSLNGCKFEQADAFRICSPSLRFLRLNNFNDEYFYEVSIHTPLLEVLIYDDNVAAGYYRMNLNSLRRAYIGVLLSDFMVDERLTDDEDFQRYNQNVVELVAACCNVEYLYLSTSSMADIHWSSNAIPMFYNLTELKLGDLNDLGWELLPHLLESAPNLETLVFNGAFMDEWYFKQIESSISNPVPTCLSLHLLSIHFEEFNGEQDGMELVHYFLKTAAVLREMKFSFCSSLPIEMQHNTWLKITSLHKCSKSKNCKIDFANENAMFEFSQLDDNRVKEEE